MSDTGNKRNISFDFIRVISALGIVVYHFFCHTSSPQLQKFVVHKNGSYGDMFVNAFFILSGMLLCMNNGKICSFSELGKFYYKRWKAIFPMFYLGYICFFARFALASGTPFFRGNPLLLIQTFFGVDGYLGIYYPDNYALIGEWFLGAIIFLYVIYPLLLWLLNKSEKLFGCIILLLYIGMVLAYQYTTIFTIYSVWNLISCLFVFSLGMLFARHPAFLDNVGVVIVAWLGMILIHVVQLPVPYNVAQCLVALFLFIILYDLGKRIGKREGLVRTGIENLSKISFAIFLVQHMTIYMVLGFRDFTEPWKALIMLIATIISTCIIATVLYVVTNVILRSKIYRTIESKLLKKQNDD